MVGLESLGVGVDHPFLIGQLEPIVLLKFRGAIQMPLEKLRHYLAPLAKKKLVQIDVVALH